MSVSHIPAALEPYLELSTEHVLEANDLQDSLVLSCGLAVERMNIDLNGVTLSAFRRFTSVTDSNRNKHIRLINQHAIENREDITLVDGRRDALEMDTHCVWVMTDGEAIEYSHPLDGSESVRLPIDVYVYERLPFAHEVASIEQLEQELQQVLPQLGDFPDSFELD